MPRPCAVDSHDGGYLDLKRPFSDATGLPRGISRLRERRTNVSAPRRKAVASSGAFESRVAASVKLHGTSPWHRKRPPASYRWLFNVYLQPTGLFCDYRLHVGEDPFQFL